MTSHRWHGGELRRRPLTGEWTVLATARSRLPHGAADCPFCPGATEDTPPETWRLPGPDGPGWRVRAVPNRYALSDRHEVLIESPRHDWDLATGTDTEAADVLHGWQQRLRTLRAGSAQVVVFRNRGTAAGTSIAHPHSQLAGLPVLSPSTRHLLDALAREHRDTGRRFGGTLIASELSAGTRIVAADDHAVAFVPFAPAAEAEVQIFPRRARADFAAVPREELDAYAQVLRTVLGALHAEYRDLAYNLIVDTAPTGWETAPFFTWSVRVVPRLAIAAGLEMATGIPVVTSAPEHTAAALRARIRTPGAAVSPA